MTVHSRIKRTWLRLVLVLVGILPTGCAQAGPFGLTPSNAQEFATDLARQLIAAFAL